MTDQTPNPGVLLPGERPQPSCPLSCSQQDVMESSSQALESCAHGGITEVTYRAVTYTCPHSIGQYVTHRSGTESYVIINDRHDRHGTPAGDQP